MNGLDYVGVIAAMEKEVETLIDLKAFVVVDKEPWMNVVFSIWAFRRKQFPG